MPTDQMHAYVTVCIRTPCEMQLRTILAALYARRNENHFHLGKLSTVVCALGLLPLLLMLCKENKGIPKI